MAARFAQARMLASLLIALCLCLPVVTRANAQERVDANSPRIELPNHVLDALGQATPLPIQKDALDDALTLTIVLRRADEQGFQAYLKDVYDSRSANYRKFLSQEDLATRFGPTVDDYQVVRRYFQANGFVVTAESRNRLTMTVRGTRQAAEATLSLRIKDWQIGARAFYANDRNPSVPPEIARRVQAISGLSNAGVPASPLGQATPTETAVCEYAGGAESAVAAFIISTATFAGTPLLTAIMSAFAVAATVVGLPAVTIGGLGVAALNVYCLGLAQGLNYPYAIVFSSAAHGARKSLATPNKQKIGLLEFDGFHATDVQNWIGLAGGDASIPARLSSVAVNGGVASPGRGESEVLLDIATVMLMNSSPNASYVVYSAPASTSFQQIFNAMIDDGVTVISNSWSDCEDQHTLADVLSIDSVLMEASASGISVFNGTGDTGATCLDGSSNTAGVPATSPHATAVGGTTPSTGPGYTYGGEAWWNGTSKSPPTGQGGFGVSRYFERPDYQSGLTSSTMRSIPDLAVPADPRTGIGICQASAGGCPTGLMYGGTSMAAPEMAAIAALLNEILGANIGEANPTLYPLQGTKAFHSPASMGTDFAHVGLGSPHLNYVRLALSHETIGPVSSAASIVASSGTAPADGTTRAVVQVNLIDNNGYPVSGKTVSLTPSVGSHATISAVSAASDVNDGAFVFNVTDATVETVTFTATNSTDAATLDHTTTIDFVSPPAATGGIVASPSSAPADGSSTSTITVTLQNALGQGARDKSVTLSQGTGHSIVTAPAAALTDVNGQIQFTVTDNVAETVTYTATDVTDGNLPVPGSTQVTFTGAGASCVTAPPVAAAGFVLTPFANGFPAQNFFYSGVSWGGCPGASNPTFDASGHVFVSDFFDGKLYRFGVSGGAVSTANTLATLGQTLYGPIFAKDGSFYILQAATGSGVSSGKIMKIDPATGTVLATLATGLTCPSPIAMDPLSGDIFFTDTCFSGATNPSLYRLLGTAGATPTVVVYATLPATGNGPVAFAADGTMYVATNYNATGSIVQVAGTDKPQPPAMITLSGISSDFWVNVAQVQASGAAKSLLVHNSNSLKLVDITTSPFTTTVLATGSNITTGTIGPDGCLYSGSSDSIFKLAPSSGACGFAAGSPLPAFTLSPSLVTPNPALGTAQTFTASFNNISVAQGTPITFYIVGANPQRKLGSTDASGTATMTYSGTFTGMDTIVATASVGPSAFNSNQARVTWAAGKHKTFVDLNLARTSSPPGQLITLTASLYDVSSASPAAIQGETLQLAIGAQSCSAVTNNAGAASCAIAPISAGSTTLTGSFAGNASYLPSSSSQPYTVASTAAGPSVPGAPVVTGVTGDNSRIIVSFNPPASDGGGAIVAYVAVCTPVGPSGAAVTVTGTRSPIVVNGVVNGVSYTCAVSAINGVGTGPPSAPSSVVTPLAPTASGEAIPTLEPLGLLALLLLLLVTVAYRWPERRP